MAFHRPGREEEHALVNCIYIMSVKLSKKNTEIIFYMNIPLKGTWGQKLTSFYGIILLIWWKKIFFVQSFVGLWSVLTKLWSYKALNLEWVTSHPQIYKTFHSWCSLHAFIDFMEKEPFTQFYGCLDHFKWTYEVAKVWMIQLCLEVSDVTHVMNIMHNMLIVACI